MPCTENTNRKKEIHTLDICGHYFLLLILACRIWTHSYYPVCTRIVFIQHVIQYIQQIKIYFLKDVIVYFTICSRSTQNTFSMHNNILDSTLFFLISSVNWIYTEILAFLTIMYSSTTHTRQDSYATQSTVKFNNFSSIVNVHFKLFQHLTAVANCIFIYSTYCMYNMPFILLLCHIESDVIQGSYTFYLQRTHTNILDDLFYVFI